MGCEPAGILFFRLRKQYKAILRRLIPGLVLKTSICQMTGLFPLPSGKKFLALGHVAHFQNKP